MENDKWIPMEECKHGGLYRIHSRNLALGVFNENTKGFVGIREKFECYYLFEEYHWDTGEPHGTVMPEALLEDCPFEPRESLRQPATEEDLKRMAEWRAKPMPVLGEEIWVNNTALFNWLVEKEKQYLGREIENEPVNEDDL
jgi:hypothetical protein